MAVCCSGLPGSICTLVTWHDRQDPFSSATLPKPHCGESHVLCWGASDGGWSAGGLSIGEAYRVSGGRIIATSSHPVCLPSGRTRCSGGVAAPGPDRLLRWQQKSWVMMMHGGRLMGLGTIRADAVEQPAPEEADDAGAVQRECSAVHIPESRCHAQNL